MHDRSLRASDADRERVAVSLRDHTVAGRLTTEELEARTGRALAARTLGELDAAILWALAWAGARLARAAAAAVARSLDSAGTPAIRRGS